MSTELDTALKIGGFAIGILALVLGFGWNLYDRIVGRQKHLSSIELAVVNAKLDIEKEYNDVKEKIRQDIQDSSRAIRNEIADLRSVVDDTREQVIIVKTKIEPFWKMVEHAILPRVNVPPTANPITPKQRDAMRSYLDLKEKTPLPVLRDARDGFYIELAEGKLDSDSVLFYSLAYGAAVAYIADLEAEDRRKSARTQQRQRAS